MSDLFVSQCGHCLGHVGVTKFEYVVEKQMTAKFNGSCGGCGDSVVADVTTIGVSDGVWVCEECFK